MGELRQRGRRAGDVTQLLPGLKCGSRNLETRAALLPLGDAADRASDAAALLLHGREPAIYCIQPAVQLRGDAFQAG